MKKTEITEVIVVIKRFPGTGWNDQVVGVCLPGESFEKNLKEGFLVEEVPYGGKNVMPVITFVRLPISDAAALAKKIGLVQIVAAAENN